MPTCPKCLHNFHRGAESLCPHCGFSLENLDKKYGRDSIPYRRVCDNAGALRQQDRVKLNALLEKLERRIPPVLLSVYFPNILEPFSLIPLYLSHRIPSSVNFKNCRDAPKRVPGGFSSLFYFMAGAGTPLYLRHKKPQRCL